MEDPGLAAAEAQAADDAAVWAKLEAERLERLAARAEQEPITILTDNPDATEESIIEPPRPMNRAERRAQVKLYALILREGEKQKPKVNSPISTIIPRSKRRRQKGQKGRLAHA